MKYLVLSCKSGSLTLEVPVLFPNIVAQHVAAALSAHNLAYPHVVAAGEVSSADCAVSCHGSSKTLGVDSRGARDSSLIHMVDYGAGIQ